MIIIIISIFWFLFNLLNLSIELIEEKVVNHILFQMVIKFIWGVASSFASCSYHYKIDRIGYITK